MTKFLNNPPNQSVLDVDHKLAPPPPFPVTRAYCLADRRNSTQLSGPKSTIAQPRPSNASARPHLPWTNGQHIEETALLVWSRPAKPGDGSCWRFPGDRSMGNRAFSRT